VLGKELVFDDIFTLAACVDAAERPIAVKSLN
jgi:hypothetical protein